MSEETHEDHREEMPLRRFTRVVRDDTGKIVDAEPADDRDRMAILEYEEKIRAILLDTIPSREEGLDLDRVDKFLDSKGLPQPPVVLLHEEDVPVLKQAFIDAGLPLGGLEHLGTVQPDGSIVRGSYYAAYETVVLIRNYEEEKKNGAGWTEAYIVHEKSHASKNKPDITYTYNKDGRVILEANPPAVGLSVFVEDGYDGNFYEEGLAELLAAEYTREVLQLPNGIYGMGTPRDEILRACIHTGDWIPSVYIWKAASEVDGSTYRTACLAAYAMELLSARSPEFKEALLLSRNDPSKVHDIPALIDAIQPGLDEFLRKQPYDARAFSAGLRRVQAALG